MNQKATHEFNNTTEITQKEKNMDKNTKVSGFYR